MEPAAPEVFCAAGRRSAKRVAGTTGERFDEPAAAKDPGPLGCALAGARGVAPAPPALPANVCVQSALGRPGSEALFAIHRNSIDVSVACWHYLLDIIREIAGATVRVLLRGAG